MKWKPQDICNWEGDAIKKLHRNTKLMKNESQIKMKKHMKIENRNIEKYEKIIEKIIIRIILS